MTGQEKEKIRSERLWRFHEKYGFEEPPATRQCEFLGPGEGEVRRM